MIDAAKRIEEIQQLVFAFGVDSHTRLEAIIRHTLAEPADVFWGVLADAWNVCDNTWAWQSVLLSMMREHQGARPHIAGITLPLQVYRGCSRPRVRGLSWTTDRAVAEKFARSHRGIRVPDPVIAEAVVERAAVFLAIDGRNESEVLIDPRRLRKLKVHAYAPDAAAA